MDELYFFTDGEGGINYPCKLGNYGERGDYSPWPKLVEKTNGTKEVVSCLVNEIGQDLKWRYLTPEERETCMQNFFQKGRFEL
jgi:hypothetical protein